MIIPIWQQLFSSSHKIAQSVGESRGEPATHTGTLDPMAQGVLVVLTGEDRFLKGKLDWPKTYDFQILWGLQTDSGDQLGLIEDVNTTNIPIEKLGEILSEFPTKYEQRAPDFSARRWKGESAFDSARRGAILPAKVRSVTLSDLTIEKMEALSFSEVLTQQQSKVSQVVGDFRQSEILESWRNAFSALPTPGSLSVTSHSVTVSPGTYIRQLVQDIAEKVAMPATTWSITRTHNGPYDRKKTYSHIQ